MIHIYSIWKDKLVKIIWKMMKKSVIYKVQLHCPQSEETLQKIWLLARCSEQHNNLKSQL